MTTSTSTGSPSSAMVSGMKAVVARIAHQRSDEAIYDQHAGFLVHFVLYRVSVLGDFTMTLHSWGRLSPGRTFNKLILFLKIEDKNAQL